MTQAEVNGKQQELMQMEKTFQNKEQMLNQDLQNESFKRLQDVKRKVEDYLSRTVYPALFQLTHQFDLKQVVIGFSLVFVFILTLLSVVPMTSISKESIQTESRRRAITLARALAQANEKVIRSNDLSNYTTDLILREDGINDVFAGAQIAVCDPQMIAVERWRDERFAIGHDGAKSPAAVVNRSRAEAGQFKRNAVAIKRRLGTGFPALLCANRKRDH
ncbi:MAG: hypothetical protein EBU49_12825 [Proteobacteria bacterium]|nr:hypothetical protein [Pseudomonadota bacterium]